MSTKVESVTGGVKADGNKPKIHMIPEEALEGMAQAFMYGARKYDRFNYKKGIEYTRLTDACIRHIMGFLRREEQDPESGLSHIDHALASLAMLRFMISRRPHMDDRYTEEATPSIKELVNQAVKEVEAGYGYAPGSVMTIKPGDAIKIAPNTFGTVVSVKGTEE